MAFPSHCRWVLVFFVRCWAAVLLRRMVGGVSSPFVLPLVERFKLRSFRRGRASCGMKFARWDSHGREGFTRSMLCARSVREVLRVPVDLMLWDCFIDRRSVIGIILVVRWHLRGRHVVLSVYLCLLDCLVVESGINRRVLILRGDLFIASVVVLRLGDAFLWVVLWWMALGSKLTKLSQARVRYDLRYLVFCRRWGLCLSWLLIDSPYFLC